MKICIIKLGADGDVLRTLPIALALKEKFSEAKITWVAKGDIKELINNLKYIEKVEDISNFKEEDYDALYNFDIEKEATDLAIKIKAKKKHGFYSEEGYPAAFNVRAEYYLNTMFDDELKKNNRKTYQEMMFMAAELPYEKYKNIKYEILLTEEDKKYALDFLEKNSLQNKKIIGIHCGAGKRWPSKAWHKERITEFILEARKRDYEILLFGGKSEENAQKEIMSELEKKKIKIFTNNPKNTKREFAALVSICDYVICSDSFSMHLALGLGIKTIALFFVTSPYEIEDYGLLKKVVSPMLWDFFPERSDEYNEELTKSISVKEVLKEVK